VKTQVKTQDCPQGTCPGGDTCCSLSTGEYGCCPYDNAECCADGQHCCPTNYVCDLQKGLCVQSVSSPSTKHYTKPIVKMINPNACPGTCSDNETCCSVNGEDYGCCPVTDGVCCDSAHCCPQGYTCDPNHASCVKSLEHIALTRVKL